MGKAVVATTAILWIVAGILIGLVGRAVAPVDKRAPVWLTILCGIAGVVVAGLGYGLVVGHGGMQWVTAIAGGVILVLTASALAGRRSPAQRAAESEKYRRSSVAAGPAPHIFLSYRRENAQALAGRIADHLKQHFPDSVVFFDVDSIAPGVNFRFTISQALLQSQVLLAVIDRHWTDETASGRRRLDEPGDFVAFELRTAAQLRIPIIPVIDPYATMPPAHALPEDLAWFADQHALHLHHDIGFDHEMVRLNDRLVTLLAQPQGQAPPTPEPKANSAASGGSRGPARWLGAVVGVLVIVLMLLVILRLT